MSDSQVPQDTQQKSPVILLVDDDTFLIDMYRVKFTKSGFIVHAAPGSEEALKVLREGLEPDILITDVVMPTMDGFELLALVRKEQLAKSSVVIILTNQNLSSDLERARQVNADGYIIKATTIPSEVLEEVKKIYAKSKKK